MFDTRLQYITCLLAINIYRDLRRHFAATKFHLAK